MAIETQYTANTGMVFISTGNSNLDGTGAGVDPVLTAGGNGTLVKTIIIKSQQSTTEGMIRFFVNNSGGSNPKLIFEVRVPKTTRSGRDRAFSKIISFDYNLASGDILYASTEKSEIFNIFALGLDWSYLSPARTNMTGYVSNTGIGIVSVANTALNGGGTTVPILTAGGSNGCAVRSIVIKAHQDVTPGMIRLFLDNGASSVLLFYELQVPYASYSSTQRSFFFKIPSKLWLYIASGYSILASTENNESFSVIANGEDWYYPS